MFYRALGLMSGSSLDGLDIAFVEFEESAGKWNYRLIHADCVSYPEHLQKELESAPQLSAYAYFELHSRYGNYLGVKVNEFIEQHGLHYQVQLIGSHGHTVFHAPGKEFTTQIGDGAAIAATTGINVVSDLRSLDVALGGNGAPIVPAGEKRLFPDYPLLLNIGGIANVSYCNGDNYIAFDICPANRVLNALANRKGKPFDAEGIMAAEGQFHPPLFEALNELAYYDLPHPKSLANEFGTETVLPLIDSFSLSIEDALHTYCRHISFQLGRAVESFGITAANSKMLITGGGAFNTFLIRCIADELRPLGIETVVPDVEIVQYKEAIIMALLAVLRWREEETVLASVTGAKRSSIGGAVWIGQ